MTHPLLHGVRVLDMSRVLAGPMCAQYLGDLGADVIKVESVDHGDDMRVWPPLRYSADGRQAAGAPYLAWNRNKRGIALNLKSPDAHQVVRRLIQRADVVIESFGPGVAARLGVDANAVRAVAPRVVHCSISGFGTVGPLKDGKGYDIILQAFAGMMSITGETAGGPVRSPFSPIDQATGMHALTGILAALHARAQTGAGAAIEVSLFDTATALLGHMLQNYWERGTEPERYGVGHESLCPYEAFDTADLPIVLGVANDPMWVAFCKLAGLEAFAADARFETNVARVKNRHDCIALVRAAMGRYTRADWITKLDAAGIPCAPLHRLGELANHPHTQASGMVFEYKHPAFGTLKTVSQPLRINGARAGLDRHPPLRGEHTHEVLKELGFNDDFIGQLVSAGVARAAG